MAKNSEIRFGIETETYHKALEFSLKYFKQLKKTEAFKFIFLQGIQRIEEQMFKGKLPQISLGFKK